jgi:predicted RND superfamily exporter protein
MNRAATAWLSFVLRRLAIWQVERPWRAIVVCVVTAAMGAALATRLELRTRFDQLLPDSQPSVVELRHLAARTGSQSNVFVVLEGAASSSDSERADPNMKGAAGSSDSERADPNMKGAASSSDSERADPKIKSPIRTLADELASKLRTLGADVVTGAEDGLQSSRAFLEPRAGLFAHLADLRQLRDDLEARWQWEVGQETGSNLDDDRGPAAVTAADIRARLGAGRFDEANRFPDGYFESKDHRAVVVVAHTAVPPGDLGRARAALDRIRAVVDGTPHPGIRESYAGDLVTGLSEYGAVRSDLVQVGVLGVALVLAVIALFFMRLRALVALGATIAAGLAWTFGATALAIGHLNVATGFLFSIVAGNGINFGIIYLARYFEERRKGERSAKALIVAHEQTWPSTLTAALAAAAAYGSLWVTDFRAFKHFAFIGGFGMIACWIATYALLPAVLVLIDRARPFAPRTGASLPATRLDRLRWFGVSYGAPLAALVGRAPRTIASVGGALAVVGAAMLATYVRSDPMEYDMRKLQNNVGQSAEMYRVAHLASDVLGAKVEGSMVVALDRAEEVTPFIDSLEARAAVAPADDRPFEAVHSLFDFVPPAQEEKIPLLLEIRERLVRAHERGTIAPADWPEISAKLPPEDLRPFGVDDLPAELARPFTERDGVRGRLVLIEPTAGKSDADLHYLLKWADSFRETRLPDGEIVHGSGRAVIFADMLQAVVRDIPRSIGLSLTMTVLAVVLTFRRRASAAVVLAALAAGIGWVSLAMVFTHTKIHFLNFVALPITFGIGVDYAVNFVQRYESDGRRDILEVLRTTGSAVILCSLTTTLGYLVLLRSVNQAIRGLGLLAVIGEVGCLLAAVLVLPSALLWREQTKRAAPTSNAPEGAAVTSERETLGI